LKLLPVRTLEEKSAALGGLVRKRFGGKWRNTFSHRCMMPNGYEKMK
jgi:hypothetical protein